MPEITIQSADLKRLEKEFRKVPTEIELQMIKKLKQAGQIVRHLARRNIGGDRESNPRLRLGSVTGNLRQSITWDVLSPRNFASNANDRRAVRKAWRVEIGPEGRKVGIYGRVHELGLKRRNRAYPPRSYLGTALSTARPAIITLLKQIRYLRRQPRG